MKYVIQLDNGFYRRIERPNRTEESVVEDVNEATVYDFEDTPMEELVEDFFVKWLFDGAKRHGENPRLAPIKLELVK